MAETRTTSSTGGQKGVKLERHDLIPIGPLKALATHYGRGARKYANHQWRQGYEWSKSYAAMVRHQTDFWSGKDYDVCSNDPDGCRHTDMDGNPFDTGEPDTCFNHTGSHHMIAAAWHAFCLFEFAMEHPGHDDRYETEPVLDYEAIADQILGQHPSPASPERGAALRRGADKILAEEQFHRTKTWVGAYDEAHLFERESLAGVISEMAALTRMPCIVQLDLETTTLEAEVGKLLGFEVELRPEPGTALRSVQESMDRRG